MSPSTISAINELAIPQKREIYSRMIPAQLVEKFEIPQDFHDRQSNDLLRFKYAPGSPSAEMSLFHQFGFRDPVQYGHMTDTLNGQIHVLLYILNDPYSPRFDVDVLPDGTKTVFGTRFRNIPEEISAMQAGLAPGQVRSGLRMLSNAIQSFENFITSLGQEVYFTDPLYYHNAAIFEKYGFAYQKGKRLMERIQTGFSAGGDLLKMLDNSTPFRKPEYAGSIRLRSWAIHDGILGEPYSGVTMYKYVGQSAGLKTCFDCSW
jgi:hypothetical protein